jgi:signal transduction histidine kinase
VRVSIHDRVSRLLRWDGGTRALLVDVALAGVVAWLGLDSSRARAWTPLVAAVVFAALLVRRRWPLLTMAISIVGLLSGMNLLSAVVALYTLASRRGPAVRTWIAAAATVAAFLSPKPVNWSTDWKYVLLGCGLFVLVPLLAGYWMFQRTGLLEALRGRAEQAERESELLAERAVAAERRRIAGEMHDVVAHRVSVIAVQSGALTVLPGDERVGQVAEVIRNNSTAALAELRDVLRVLRADNDEAAAPAEVAPPPGLDGIPSLVDDSRATGTVVDFEMPVPLPETTAPVARAAYRVAQEALTNVNKHAHGSRARVTLTATGDGLAVEVANTRPEGRAPLATELPSSGYGLVGMRERVALAGGTVRAGHTDDGGFLVHAVFPPRFDGEPR